MRVGRGKAASKISLPRLGTAARANADGPFTSVPVFVGLDSVSIRKRLNITRIVRQTRDRLPMLYASLFASKG